jgi:hypothetical protein
LCEIVNKPINNLNGVLSGITRHNTIYTILVMLLRLINSYTVKVNAILIFIVLTRKTIAKHVIHVRYPSFAHKYGYQRRKILIHYFRHIMQVRYVISVVSMRSLVEEHVLPSICSIPIYVRAHFYSKYTYAFS